MEHICRRLLAVGGIYVSDGQTNMSKKGRSPICEWEFGRMRKYEVRSILDYSKTKAKAKKDGVRFANAAAIL